MKVLMLGRWLPIPRRPETASRAYRLARALAREHAVTLAFVTDEPNPAGAIGLLRAEFDDLEFATVPRGWQVLSSALSLATGESCTLAYHRSTALRTRLADRVRTSRYDLVVTTSSGMIDYALGLPDHLPILMDFGTVDSEWWLRQAEARGIAGARFCRTEGLRLRSAEAAMCRRATHSLVATQEAERTLRSIAPDAPITVVPDGIDGAALARMARVSVAPRGARAAEEEAFGIAPMDHRRDRAPIRRTPGRV